MARVRAAGEAAVNAPWCCCDYSGEGKVWAPLSSERPDTGDDT